MLKRIPLIITVVGLSLLLAAGCNQPEDNGNGANSGGVSASHRTPGDLPENTIALVEGVPISKDRLDAKVANELAMYEGSGIEIDDKMKYNLKREAFARMASDLIAIQKAEELGVAASLDDATANANEVAERMGGEDAVLAYLGQMGGTIKTMDDFIEWRRLEMSREALIEKIGEDVTVDEESLKAKFDELMAEFEKSRDEDKPAFLPAKSFEEFVEREKLQARLVKYDKYMDGALTTAKLEIFDPELEGAIEDFLKADAEDFKMPMPGMSAHGNAGGNPHGGMSGNPHGEMPPGHTQVDESSDEDDDSN